MRPGSWTSLLAVSLVLAACKPPEASAGAKAAPKPLYLFKSGEQAFVQEFSKEVACQPIRPGATWTWEDLESKVKVSEARHAAFLEFKTLHRPGDEVLEWTDTKGFLQSRAPESLAHLDPDDPYGRSWTPLNAKNRDKEPSYGSAVPTDTRSSARKVPYGICLSRNHEVVAVTILGSYWLSH